MLITKTYRNNRTTLFSGQVSFKKYHDTFIIEETRHKDGSRSFHEVELHKTELCKLLEMRFKHAPKAVKWVLRLIWSKYL